MINFWNKLPRPFTVLAPMDDVTDNTFRQVVLSAERPDVFFTEFTNVDGLVHGANGIPLRKLEFTSEQHPIVAQLWGNNPENFEKSASTVKKLGFDGIDINMGCPIRDVVKKGSGSGLIGQYDLVEKIIKSVKKGVGNLPVSVKTRLGLRQNVGLAWAEFLLKNDISALTIHGRTAAEMSKKPADWDEIGKIVELKNKVAPKTAIIGNGDVKSYEEVAAKSKKYGVDGVMIGRGIFANPWVFDKNTDSVKHTRNDYMNLLFRHIDLFEKSGKSNNFATIKKFFKMYVNNFAGAGNFRAKLMEAKNLEEVKSLLILKK